jgi:hypothetical protein
LGCNFHDVADTIDGFAELRRLSHLRKDSTQLIW